MQVHWGKIEVRAMSTERDVYNMGHVGRITAKTEQKDGTKIARRCAKEMP